jgi:hypothetical protein
LLQFETLSKADGLPSRLFVPRRKYFYGFPGVPAKEAAKDLFSSVSESGRAIAMARGASERRSFRLAYMWYSRALRLAADGQITVSGAWADSAECLGEIGMELLYGPRVSRLHLHQHRAKAARKFFDAALRHACHAVRTGPTDPAAWHALGFALVRKSRRKAFRAVEYVDKAIALDVHEATAAYRKEMSPHIFGVPYELVRVFRSEALLFGPRRPGEWSLHELVRRLKVPFLETRVPLAEAAYYLYLVDIELERSVQKTARKARKAVTAELARDLGALGNAADLEVWTESPHMLQLMFGLSLDPAHGVLPSPFSDAPVQLSDSAEANSAMLCLGFLLGNIVCRLLATRCGPWQDCLDLIVQRSTLPSEAFVWAFVLASPFQRLFVGDADRVGQDVSLRQLFLRRGGTAAVARMASTLADGADETGGAYYLFLTSISREEWSEWVPVEEQHEVFYGWVYTAMSARAPKGMTAALEVIPRLSKLLDLGEDFWRSATARRVPFGAHTFAYVRHERLRAGRANRDRSTATAMQRLAKRWADGAPLECLRCGRRSRTPIACGSCGAVWYCRPLCMADDREQHAAECSAATTSPGGGLGAAWPIG